MHNLSRSLLRLTDVIANAYVRVLDLCVTSGSTVQWLMGLDPITDMKHQRMDGQAKSDSDGQAVPWCLLRVHATCHLHFLTILLAIDCSRVGTI